MTPVERIGWTVSLLDSSAEWVEIFNSDSVEFWGTGQYHNKTVRTIKMKGVDHCSMRINLPPLGAVVFKRNEVKK